MTLSLGNFKRFERYFVKNGFVSKRELNLAIDILLCVWCRFGLQKEAGSFETSCSKVFLSDEEWSHFFGSLSFLFVFLILSFFLLWLVLGYDFLIVDFVGSGRILVHFDGPVQFAWRKCLQQIQDQSEEQLKFRSILIDQFFL